MITLNEAMKIVANNDAFYFKDEEVKERKFRIFNYRLGSYSDFSENTLALELRGLTFDLETEKSYLGLHKFFNDNENPFAMIEWDENDVLDVREKLDGSLIQSFYIEDELFVKTKGSFNSEQAKMAEEFILKNENYQKFIKFVDTLQLQVFFELVSPFNQIVIQYNKTDLRLIQARNKFNGEYVNYNTLKDLAKMFNVSITKECKFTLKKLRELQKTENDIEGWVVRNSKYPLETQFRKVKTESYFLKHHLISGDNLVENKVIAQVLDENIDDILAQLDKNSEKRKFIEEIEYKVSHHFDKNLKHLEMLFVIKEKLDRKTFALKYKNEKYFNVIMKAKNESDLENLLKENIKKRTAKLNDAKKFLEELK